MRQPGQPSVSPDWPGALPPGLSAETALEVSRPFVDESSEFHFSVTQHSHLLPARTSSAQATCRPPPAMAKGHGPSQSISPTIAPNTRPRNIERAIAATSLKKPTEIGAGMHHLNAGRVHTRLANSKTAQDQFCGN